MLSQPYLGQALRRLRTRRHLKQFEAADQAEITKAMLSSYETGVSVPSLSSLASILRSLGADLHELQDVLDDIMADPVPPVPRLDRNLRQEDFLQLLERTSEMKVQLDRLTTAVLALVRDNALPRPPEE